MLCNTSNYSTGYKLSEILENHIYLADCSFPSASEPTARRSQEGQQLHAHRLGLFRGLASFRDAYTVICASPHGAG